MKERKNKVTVFCLLNFVLFMLAVTTERYFFVMAWFCSYPLAFILAMVYLCPWKEWSR